MDTSRVLAAACAALLSFFSVDLPAVSAAGATPARLGSATCEGLRSERQRFTQTGIIAELQRGPEWAKANLSPDRLLQIEAYIRIDEDLKFGCRDAVLSPQAVLARDAAKRLELNPNVDPTAPPAATDRDETSAPSGSKDRPAANRRDMDSKAPEKKPKAAQKKAPVRDSHDAARSVPKAATGDPEARPAPEATPQSSTSDAPPPIRQWVPIGDANAGRRPGSGADTVP
ncbi:MAG: hypothetical protein K2X41_06490 [Hyphomicrobium sp.]|nr:hypothetical protein [Hyphomicrobium sp.]